MASSIVDSLSWDTQSVRQIAEVGPGLCFPLPTFSTECMVSKKGYLQCIAPSNRSVPLGGWSELYLPCIFLLGLKFCYEFISLWNVFPSLIVEFSGIFSTWTHKTRISCGPILHPFASKVGGQSYFGYAWDYCRVGCGGQSSASRIPEVVASHLCTWHKCCNTC